MFARKLLLDSGKRHLVRALALNRFYYVAGLYPRFVRRTPGKHRDHSCVAEALRNSGANIGMAIVLVTLVELVLLRIEVAGIGVE